MKVLHKLVIGILGTIAVIWTAVDYLAIPVVLVVIGLVCGFSWEYYVISLTVYVVLVLLVHLIGHFMDKAFDKTIGRSWKRSWKSYLTNLQKTKRTKHNQGVITYESWGKRGGIVFGGL